MFEDEFDFYLECLYTEWSTENRYHITALKILKTQTMEAVILDVMKEFVMEFNGINYRSNMSP